MTLWNRVLFASALYMFLSRTDCARCDPDGLTHCSTSQLNSFDYQSFSASGSGDDVISDLITLRIDLNVSSYLDLNGTTFHGYNIQGVCDGAKEVNPLMFEKSSSCDVGVGPDRNHLTLHNCTDEIVCSSDCGIVIRNCTTCVELYIVDTINCSTYCAITEITSSDASALVMKPEEIDNLWDVCPSMDLGEVLAEPDMECLRNKCVTFFEDACSCCSRTCPEHIHYNVNASTLCPSDLVTNCQSMSAEQDYCQAFCKPICLDCEDDDSTFCQSICKDPFQNPLAASEMINFCRDEMEILEIETFCTNQISTNCSTLTLPDVNCRESPDRCADICRQEGVLGFLGKGCPSEVFMFCGQYTLDLLNSSSTLTDEIFMAYVDVIESFLKDVSPASVVDRLQTLLRNLNDTGLLTTNSNVELLLGVFDDLFDDVIRFNWTSLKGTQPAFKVLDQLETLGELMETNFINNRNSSFSYKGDNLAYVVTPIEQIKADNNHYHISIGDEENEDDLIAKVAIPNTVLCGEPEDESCSSVVAVVIANNLADYLQNNSGSARILQYPLIDSLIAAAQLLGLVTVPVRESLSELITLRDLTRLSVYRRIVASQSLPLQAGICFYIGRLTDTDQLSLFSTLPKLTSDYCESIDASL